MCNLSPCHLSFVITCHDNDSLWMILLRKRALVDIRCIIAIAQERVSCSRDKDFGSRNSARVVQASHRGGEEGK